MNEFTMFQKPALQAKVRYFENLGKVSFQVNFDDLFFYSYMLTFKKLVIFQLFYLQLFSAAKYFY